MVCADTTKTEKNRLNCLYELFKCHYLGSPVCASTRLCLSNPRGRARWLPTKGRGSPDITLSCLMSNLGLGFFRKRIGELKETLQTLNCIAGRWSCACPPEQDSSHHARVGSTGRGRPWGVRGDPPGQPAFEEKPASGGSAPTSRHTWQGLNFLPQQHCC